ncbi:hypothetical protein [Clostridium thermarum]|uniref:hypothetical protein n=1 Tax=Clostridium thermarum TaxID=1716543 RepID=UPI001123DFC4|nr:hypothetical protein [Clostridium thermarum]
MGKQNRVIDVEIYEEDNNNGKYEERTNSRREDSRHRRDQEERESQRVKERSGREHRDRKEDIEKSNTKNVGPIDFNNIDLGQIAGILQNVDLSQLAGVLGGLGVNNNTNNDINNVSKRERNKDDKAQAKAGGNQDILNSLSALAGSGGGEGLLNALGALAGSGGGQGLLGSLASFLGSGAGQALLGNLGNIASVLNNSGGKGGYDNGLNSTLRGERGVEILWALRPMVSPERAALIEMVIQLYTIGKILKGVI